MTESGQVERAARRAIARAKARGDTEVTPDDLLVGALSEVSRFGVAWIGDRAVDVRALARNGASADRGSSAPSASGSDGGAEEGPTAPAPAYSPATVELFERAAALARGDGAGSMGLVHLLAAFTDVECGLMETLLREHGFSEVEWRAQLARGVVGAPPRLVGPDGSGTAGGSGRPGGPEILGVDDAAEYLGVHAQTVRNYIRSGKLPAYRLAGERYIRVLRKDLLALLERVRTDSEDEEETT